MSGGGRRRDTWRGSGSGRKIPRIPAWGGGGLVAIGMLSFVGVGCVLEAGATEGRDPNVGILREVTRQVTDGSANAVEWEETKEVGLNRYGRRVVRAQVLVGLEGAV